jgi:hypothetical protein
MDGKELIRLLGTGDRDERAKAASLLAEQQNRAAIRPLMNTYLNYGDAPVLEALGSFGNAVTGPATSEAFDLSIIGQRRARLMDVLGATGDETALGAVRDFVDDSEKPIHIRACAALARLGDLNGVDMLSADLQQGTDAELRTLALAALDELGDTPGAREAINGHIERYVAEGGAIPHDIAVLAPRLDDPERPMTAFVVEEIKKTERDLVLVIGSGALELARSRQSDLKTMLEGHELYFLTQEMVPEEQMDQLDEARDIASADPDHTVLVIGKVPAPSDNPPLRHFLTTGKGGSDYSVKIIIVDPHEYTLLMDWWRYVEDQAQVETVFEVVLSASTPNQSAISQEEWLIHKLAPEDHKREFARALLAHF